jgi:hypothetical protein
MHALKKTTRQTFVTLRQFCGCGSRTRRGANGLQVPRHPTLLARKRTTLERFSRNQACDLALSTVRDAPGPECVSALCTTSYARAAPSLFHSCA